MPCRLEHGNSHLVGVISDTHGLLRSAVVQAFAGTELIIHAGDIGKSAVLEALEEVAPVVAVRGNMDRGEWTLKLSETEVVEVGDTLLYVLHNVKKLDLDPGAAGFSAVISGHTHRPATEDRGGVLFVNPGSAGPPRFRFPVSVALLKVHGKSVKAQVVELEV